MHCMQMNQGLGVQISKQSTVLQIIYFEHQGVFRKQCQYVLWDEIQIYLYSNSEMPIKKKKKNLFEETQMVGDCWIDSVLIDFHEAHSVKCLRLVKTAKV